MTSALAVPSKLDTHHDPGEVREAVELDRLRLMREYSRHHSVTCDCLSDQRITEDDCAGLQVLNARGHQVASYRGTQYRPLRRANGSIAIFSTLLVVRN
jgi:hypothetical protein